MPLEGEKDLHGDYGIAIIVQLDWSKERTDGLAVKMLAHAKKLRQLMLERVIF